MRILKKRIVKGRRTASRMWGKTAVIILLPDGKRQRAESIFTLEGGCAFVWSLLEQGPQFKAIINSFAKRYRIKKEDAASELLRLVRSLQKKQLIDVVDTVAGVPADRSLNLL